MIVQVCRPDIAAEFVCVELTYALQNYITQVAQIMLFHIQIQLLDPVTAVAREIWFGKVLYYGVFVPQGAVPPPPPKRS